MAEELIHILLVEDNPGDARLVREALRDAAEYDPSAPGYTVSVADRLSAAFELLDTEAVDVILLDLALPDSDGIDTFQSMQARASDYPIVVLTRQEDDSLGARAMRDGAQDYLTKAQFDAASLVRSVRYARERKQAERDRVNLVRAQAARVEADEQRARLEAARAAAEASEAHFRMLADTMPQLVWRTRPDGYHDYYNQRWYDYTGLSADESAGGRWADPLHPDDRERSHKLWAESLQTGEHYEIEYRFRRHDGLYRWFLGRALPMRDAQGTIVKWFGTCTDIDDQKRAERSLTVLAEAGAALAAPLDSAALLESIARLVVPTIADWSCVYVRDAGHTRLVAAAHVEPSSERKLRQLFESFPDADDVPHGYASVIRSGASELLATVPQDMTGILAHGSPQRALLDALQPVSAMTVPLAVAGRTFGALSLVSSSSGRRYGRDDLSLAEEIGRRVAVALDSARMFELAQAERLRAEEANRAKDEFLSVASHELRTPLGAILGWSRMLRAGTLSEDKRERALEIIERNARVQVQLIEDILDVSRIITGKLRLEITPVEAVQVVEAALDVVRPAADAKGVRVVATVDPDTGVLHGDAARLQQVLWNLLANAVKFTSQGGLVQLHGRLDGAHVEFTVSDDGQGIEPGFVQHVFEPFRQADGTSTRAHGGLGLGLAIVKHLVELHGGRIAAHSEGRGRGAVFTVRLPVSAPSLAVEAAVSTPARDERNLSAVTHAQVRGLRVLVVDDQPDARELIKSILDGSGADATTAASVGEAMELWRARPPDVLVSDIGMPEEDGYSLIRRVRTLPLERGGRVPAIALTAYSRAEDRARALREGFTSHVSKPVEPQELLAAIAQVATQVGAR